MTGVQTCALPICEIAPEPVIELPVIDKPAVEEPAVEPVDDFVELPIAEIPTDSATVTNMVDRLELAVAQRQDQIAKLEALANAEITKSELVVAMPVPVEEAEPSIVPEPPRQTILEAVPSEPATEMVEDDMDAALRSALETLHRMNVRTR